MSLVICSNDTDEQGALTSVKSSIFKPWAWRNDLSSTLTLPANAQVALQSAKINMDGTISLGNKSQRTFYWQFGKVPGLQDATSDYYAAGATETTSFPVKVVLFENQGGKVQTNRQELAAELTAALNRACFHPNFRNRIVVTEVFDGATNLFTGFKFTFAAQINTGGHAPVNSIPYADTSKMLDSNIYDQRKYQLLGVGTAPPYTLTRTAGSMDVTMPAGVVDEPQSVILNVPPLNLKGGRVAFGTTGIEPSLGPNASRWACGLTRPSIRGNQNPQMINPFWFKHGNGGGASRWLNYYDYGVRCNLMGDDPNSPGSKDFLRLFHTVTNPLDTLGAGRSTSDAWKLLPKIQSIKYGDGTGGSVDTGTDPLVVAAAGWSNDYGYNFATNPLSITGIIFEVSGQQVTIKMHAGVLGVGTEYTLIDYDATRHKEFNLKPVTQGAWSLLPQITIANRGSAGGGQKMEFVRFDGTDVNWADFNFMLNHSHIDYGIDNTLNNTSWELATGIGSTRHTRAIEARVANDYGVGLGAVSPYVYDGVAAGPANNFTHQKPVMILTRQDETLYPFTRGANASRLLGFPDRGVIDFVAFDAVTTRNWSVSSIATPVILPTSSIFVRLHGFNQQSTNAKARGKSDIIAHLPRFDGVNTLGPLYLEPNNMLYLDLNNPAPIKMNTFDISFCYSNEQYATGLTGTSIVCLHFRAAPK